MSRRRSRSRPRPRTSAGEVAPEPVRREPFNNPFHSALSGVEVADSRPLSADKPARQTGSPPGRTDGAAEAGNAAAGDDLDTAMKGVARIDHTGDRVRIRRRAGGQPVRDAHSQDIAEMDSPTFDIRYSEHYIRGRAGGVNHETLRKLEHGEIAVKDHLDLHGMVVEDAERAVDRFLSDSQRRGVHCVLVITGKGRNSAGGSGVLCEKIPHWLARGPSSRRVLAFVTARPCDGGEGALYVLLRRRPGGKGGIDVVTGGVGP